MRQQSGAAAYAAVGVESKVLSASQHELIVLLFDGALGFIRTARVHMEDKNVEGCGHFIGRALDVVNEGLIGSLNTEVGGDLAQNLLEMYEYVGQSLLTANLKQSPEYLDTAEKILIQLSSGWREITGDKGSL